MSAPTHLPTRPATPAPARVSPGIGVKERPAPTTGDGDHDRFAHYVSKRELAKARRKGGTVTALCGKRWKPDADPQRYPVCPTCAELAAQRIADAFGG